MMEREVKLPAVGRLWKSAWLASTLIIFAAETMPWSNFQGHSHWAKVCWIPFGDRSLPGFWWDVLSNMALFAPFGFTGIHARKAKTFRASAQIVALAALFSAAGELFQVYCHNRFPSMTDVSTNTAGAILGVILGFAW
jgi:glycopeptide antibiotics resistance protein